MVLEHITNADLIVIRQRVIKDATEGRSYSAVFGIGENPNDLGIKNPIVLQSALDRQIVSLGSRLKHPTPVTNAATLAYGLATNHPYHDGNKRTALVAMLAHLDKNGLVLAGVRHKVLVQVMENLAQSKLPLVAATGSSMTLPRKSRSAKKIQKALDRPSSKSDEVVNALADFLSIHIRSRKSYGRVELRYRDLRAILERHGLRLHGPISGNKMEVFRQTSPLERLSFFHKPRKVATIGWPGDHRVVSQGALKLVRKKCHLEERDGVDDPTFFDLAQSVEGIVREYHGVLRRLETR